MLNTKIATSIANTLAFHNIKCFLTPDMYFKTLFENLGSLSFSSVWNLQINFRNGRNFPVIAQFSTEEFGMCPTTNFTYIFSLNWAPELLCCPNNLQNYFCNRKDLIRLSEGHNLEERGRRGSISGFLRSFSFWC